LTRWEQRGILRQPGCPCLGRILRIRLHPHESRKTSQTVVCCILFVNKCSARLSLARHGRGETSSAGRPAGRGTLPLATQRISAAAAPAWDGRFWCARSKDRAAEQSLAPPSQGGENRATMRLGRFNRGRLSVAPAPHPSPLPQGEGAAARNSRSAAAALWRGLRALCPLDDVDDDDQ